MDRRGERGFTLIELMITVAIIALLATIAVPAFFGESRKAKAKSVKGGLLPAVHAAFDKYRGATPPNPVSINPGVQVMGDGSV